MSRWGQEESKTKGIGGCLVALIVFAGTIFVFLKIYPVIEGRRELEEEVQRICRAAHGKTESMVLADIMASVRNLGLTVERENIKIQKDKDANQNIVLKVHLSYVHTADFGFFTKDFPVSISESVVLVVF